MLSQCIQTELSAEMKKKKLPLNRKKPRAVTEELVTYYEFSQRGRFGIQPPEPAKRTGSAAGGLIAEGSATICF